MNAEQELRLLIGDMTVANIGLRHQLAEAEKEIERLKGEPDKTPDE